MGRASGFLDGLTVSIQLAPVCLWLIIVSGTGLSIACMYQFGWLLLKVKSNSVYHTVTTTSLSVSENSMCIIVACLPPLRRTFDNILKKILPQRVLIKIGALDSNPSYNLPTIDTTKMTLDGESSHNILLDEDYIEDENGRIVRVTSLTARRDNECVVGSSSNGQKSGKFGFR